MSGRSDIRRGGRAGGFTLLEMLIAVTVLAIVMTIIYESYSVCSKTVEVAGAQSDLYQSARLALRRLTDDLSCTYAPISADEGADQDDEEAKAAAKAKADKANAEAAANAGDEEDAQDEADAKTAASGGGGGAATDKGFTFRAVDGGSGAEARDSIEFTSTAVLSRNGKVQPDFCQIQYEVSEQEDGEGGILTRTTDVGEAGSIELASNVKGLDFQFYGPGGEEHPDWDSAASGSKLPSRVVITLTLLVSKDSTDTVAFTTAVNIPAAWERAALGKGLAMLAAQQDESKKASASDGSDEDASAADSDEEDTGPGAADESGAPKGLMGDEDEE